MDTAHPSADVSAAAGQPDNAARIFELNADEKDELLLRLLNANEIQRQKQNGYSSKYLQNRKSRDEDFRKIENKRSLEYQSNKYWTDPDFRERKKAKAKQYYEARKDPARVQRQDTNI